MHDEGADSATSLRYALAFAPDRPLRDEPGTYSLTADAALHPSERAPRPIAAGVRRATQLLLAMGLCAAFFAGLVTVSRLSAQPAADPASATVRVPVPAPPVRETARVDTASPARGTTGTIALPPPPVVAGPIVIEVGITPARAFSMAAASTLDRARALECLTTAIYYEAASESDAGQRAVAQVILNRARHPAFPATVCGVVYQGSEKSGCQFSFACDGAMARAPSRAGLMRAGRNASAALAGGVFAGVGLATHYHTYAVTPAWNRTLVMTDAIGAHFFHRWKGYWGTAPAFRQRYTGHEPVPGPHPRTAPALLPGLPTALAIAATTSVPPVPAKPVATAAATIQPRHAGTSVPRDETDLPGESQVLDRWKDSGKPLR